MVSVLEPDLGHTRHCSSSQHSHRAGVISSTLQRRQQRLRDLPRVTQPANDKGRTQAQVCLTPEPRLCPPGHADSPLYPTQFLTSRLPFLTGAPTRDGIFANRKEGKQTRGEPHADSQRRWLKPQRKMESLLERNKIFFFLLQISCKCSRFQCKSLQNDFQEKLGLSNVKEWYNLQKINIYFHLKEDAFLDLKSAGESRGSRGRSALWVFSGSLVRE